PWRNIARTLAQAVLFWLVFFAALPAGLYALEGAVGASGLRFGSAGWRAAGILLFGIAGCLNVTCAYMMAVPGCGTPLPLACPRRLVVVGPYRYVRNPMAISALTQGAAVGLFLGSPFVVLYAAAGAVFWQVLVRPWEEHDLEQRFGPSYRHYCREVRC